MRLSRVIPSILLLLTAGFVTTFAVVYAGAILYPPHLTAWKYDDRGVYSRSLTPSRSVYIYIDSEEQSQHPDVSTSSADKLLRHGRSLRYTPSWRDEYNHSWWSSRTWHLYEGGWPWRATWGWACTHPVNNKYKVTRGGALTLRSLYAPRTPIQGTTTDVPYLPLWPGLILNTLFYAGIWWALLAILRFIRRTLRTRRGLCPSCGYDMQGLSNTPCPECGHAATRPRTPSWATQRE